MGAENPSDFLADHPKFDWLPVTAFNRHLKDAYKRGIIGKEGRYYVPKLDTQT